MNFPSRDSCKRLDSMDSFAAYRRLFHLPEGMIYLDGNSLGVLPHATKTRLAKAVTQEWGDDLITSWNKNGWINLPVRVGDKIAALIGAAPGQVVACDSISINMHKIVQAALAANPGRIKILSTKDNFPTDLYVVQGIVRSLGAARCELQLVGDDEIEEAVDEDTALLMLTEVDFRTGRLYDMQKLTHQAQEKGALVCWDLAHSAGAIPVFLDACNVDYAVGCGYKYLNGGPGAPAFLYVAHRHQGRSRQPLFGWHGHARPFDFSTEYAAADTVEQFLCGTPSVLAMCALEESLEIWSDVDFGALRRKSLALCDLFIQLVEARCAGFGFELMSPRASALRGSQVSFAHPEGYALIQALIAQKVIGDFRAPDIMRFGFTPLYIGYCDIWDAVDRLVQVIADKSYQKADYKIRAAVT